MTDQPDPDAERRAFLKAAGKFAVTVPPAMTFLLTTSLSSNAIATSGNNDSNSAPPDPNSPPPSGGPDGDVMETFP
jgi:hypothetical protein